ncbi:MAG: hypothetical protein ACK4NS_09915 [Saprospiraceae bacterium]
MRRLPNLFWMIWTVATVHAQTGERSVDFRTLPEDEGLRFEALTPPLQQIAGAPAAFYDYYWEFGDGQFSFEERPLHRYASSVPREALLLATGKYDNGKAPRSRKKTVAPPATAHKQAVASASPSVLPNPSARIALRAVRNPRAGEESVWVMGYGSGRAGMGAGSLYLFFNQRDYKTRHFEFVEARTHHGEEAIAPQWSACQSEPLSDGLVCAAETPAGAGPYGSFYTPDEALRQLRQTYRDSRAWRFSELGAGEVRHIFLSLMAAESMIADTHAVIMASALWIGDGGGELERFDLEMEILASHDPNYIVTLRKRTGFRRIAAKEFGYKVRFQNTGEGPASKVAVTCRLPRGLDPGSLRLLDAYPACPPCAAVPAGQSCLDTARYADRIEFTFRNVYLPGTRQQGVGDRDSTKGFLRFSLKPSGSVSKLPMPTRAHIVFDKNAPVFTNATQSTFKPGFSPMPFAGWLSQPTAPRGGALVLGLGAAPFRPWRKYLQFEIMAVLDGGMREQAETRYDSTAHALFLTAFDIPAIVDSFRTTVREERIEASHSVWISPLHLRKNVSDFVGIGAGALLGLQRRQSSVKTTVTERQMIYATDLPLNTPRNKLMLFMESGVSYEPVLTEYDRLFAGYGFFAEISLGAVRRGPSLSLRPQWTQQAGKSALSLAALLTWRI